MWLRFHLSVFRPWVVAQPIAIREIDIVSQFKNIAAACAFVLVSFTSEAFAEYIITDLGTLPGGHYSYARGINSSGQVVGTSGSTNGEHAFLYSGGSMQDLGALPGAANISAANAINDSGQVVGSSNQRAFLYSGGVMHDLGTLPGADSRAYSTEAFAINNNGQIAGTSAGQAFLYAGGNMHALGTLLGGALSFGSGTNNSGQVVGYSYVGPIAAGEFHAFLYSGGNMQDIGVLQGSTYNMSFATGINDNGEVVGGSYAPDGRQHAFLYAGGSIQDLGAPPGDTSSIAWAINNSGQIVGRSSGANPSKPSAFVYSHGTMYDLATLLANGSGWQDLAVYGINYSGQIVGQGRIGDETHALLLTPVPEPATYAMILAGLGMLTLVARRRKSTVV